MFLQCSLPYRVVQVQIDGLRHRKLVDRSGEPGLIRQRQPVAEQSDVHVRGLGVRSCRPGSEQHGAFHAVVGRDDGDDRLTMRVLEAVGHGFRRASKAR